LGGHAIKGDLKAIMTCMQNFHQSMWDYEILYADISSEDEPLLIKTFLLKKNQKKKQTWRAVEI
jgi:hypothetical protein